MSTKKMNPQKEQLVHNSKVAEAKHTVEKAQQESMFAQIELDRARKVGNADEIKACEEKLAKLKAIVAGTVVQPKVEVEPVTAAKAPKAKKTSQKNETSQEGTEAPKEGEKAEAPKTTRAKLTPEEKKAKRKERREKRKANMTEEKKSEVASARKNRRIIRNAAKKAGKTPKDYTADEKAQILADYAKSTADKAAPATPAKKE